MRTVFYAYTTVMLDAFLELERQGKIELINFFAEFADDHPKLIRQAGFFSPWHGLNRATQDLVHKYTDNLVIPEDLYAKMYEKLYFYIECFERHEHLEPVLSFHDSIHAVNIALRFAYGYLTKEKIEQIVFWEVPHSGVDNMLYLVAKYLGIKTLLLGQEFQPDNFLPIITYYYDENDKCYYQSMKKKVRNVKICLEEGYKKDLFYMHNIKYFTPNINVKRKKMIIMSLNILKNAIRLKKIKNTFFWNPMFLYFFHNFRKFYLAMCYITTLKSLIRKVDYQKKYVYFPLHLQPEMTTSIMGEKYYNDQILALEQLRALIPTDWIIYVKENPKQTSFYRPKSFFERFKLLKNTFFVPREENTYKLLEHSQFVATISGTAAFESIRGGKPALIFGKVWWHSCPGVFKYSPNLDVQKMIETRIDHKELEKKASEFCSKCYEGIVSSEKNFQHLFPNYSHEKNTKNLVKMFKQIL